MDYSTAMGIANNNTSGGGELFEKFQRQKLSRETGSIGSAGINNSGSNGDRYVIFYFYFLKPFKCLI